MSLEYWIYLVIGFPVLVTPFIGVVENVQEVLAQEQEQQNASSSNATTSTSTTQGLLQTAHHLEK
jgi:hypothetical protein